MALAMPVAIAAGVPIPCFGHCGDVVGKSTSEREQAFFSLRPSFNQVVLQFPPFIAAEAAVFGQGKQVVAFDQ